MAQDTHHDVVSTVLRNSSLSGVTSLHASHCSFLRQSLCEYVECSYKANIKLEHKNVSPWIFRMALSGFFFFNINQLRCYFQGEAWHFLKIYFLRPEKDLVGMEK